MDNATLAEALRAAGYNDAADSLRDSDLARQRRDAGCEHAATLLESKRAALAEPSPESEKRKTAQQPTPSDRHRAQARHRLHPGGGMSTQYIGEVPGRAGQKLARLEREQAALEAQHHERQRQQQEAQREAARCDQELQRLEAAEMAGRSVGRELTAARKASAEAEQRASEPWARRISVVADAVTLKQQERGELVSKHFTELDGLLLAAFDEAAEQGREAMRQVIAAEDRQNQLASQRTKLAQLAAETRRQSSTLPLHCADTFDATSRWPHEPCVVTLECDGRKKQLRACLVAQSSARR